MAMATPYYDPKFQNLAKPSGFANTSTKTPTVKKDTTSSYAQPSEGGVVSFKLGKAGASNKAYLKAEGGKTLKFQFNPNEFDDSQNFNYNILQSPCSNYPLFHYTGTGERQINLTLFVYGIHGEPQEYLDYFDSLAPKQRFEKPKQLTFAFGKYIKKCVLTSITRNIKDTNDDLSPRHVEIGLTLLEVK